MTIDQVIGQTLKSAGDASPRGHENVICGVRKKSAHAWETAGAENHHGIVVAWVIITAGGAAIENQDWTGDMNGPFAPLSSGWRNQDFAFAFGKVVNASQVRDQVSNAEFIACNPAKKLA